MIDTILKWHEVLVWIDQANNLKHGVVGNDDNRWLFQSQFTPWVNELTSHYKGVKSMFITILILTRGLILRDLIGDQDAIDLANYAITNKCEVDIYVEHSSRKCWRNHEMENGYSTKELNNDVDSKYGTNMSRQKHLKFRKESMCKNFKGLRWCTSKIVHSQLVSKLGNCYQKIAMEEVEGDATKQYTFLWSYNLEETILKILARLC
ncbi:hypothetical protein CR513_39902, partial [Mucuna pruriens]